MNRYIVLLLLFVQGLYAQVEFKAVPSKTTLGINERLSIEFTMNGDGDNFNPPSFKGFTVSGPTQTISNTWINKKQSYNKTYTYILQPKARGTFTIGQASIEIDGKIYKTVPFKVTVTGAVQSGYGSGTQTASKVGEGIYVVAEVSNKNPYINEPVTVQFRIYVDEDASVGNYDQLDSPQYNGFWSQQIPFKQAIEEGMFRGKLHRFITFEKSVLYPQKSGPLEIEPVSMNVFIEVPTGRIDPLGREINRVVPKVFSSEKVVVNVKPLPEKGRPAGFNGAVGDFTFKAAPSKTTVAGGESLQLSVSVSGNGNFKLFDLPKPAVPEELELYDPERNDKVTTTISGLRGTLTDVYTIVPQEKGKFKIQPIAFSFFDPKLGVYRTITSAETTIDVLTGSDASAAADKDVDDVPENSKRDGDEHAGFKGNFLTSPIFYILLGLLIIMSTVALYFMKKSKSVQNTALKEPTIESPQPHNLARAYLAEAKAHVGTKEPFYLALEKALHNLLKAKLSIGTSDMTKQNIRELLNSKGADRTTIEDFIKVMESCAFARYAPSSGEEMQRDYDNAENVVSNLEKQI